MEDSSVLLSDFTPSPLSRVEPGPRAIPEAQWWVRTKPNPTPSEARAELGAYAMVVCQMEEAARVEQQTIQRAAEVADAVEYEFLRKVAADYAGQRLSQLDLADIYHSYRALARSGYYRRWDAVIPFLSDEIVTGRFNEPDADGCWSGPYPIREYGQSVPRDGQSVVYWLIDEDGVDCYIGSTQRLRKRLKTHQKDKAFVAWRAVPHPSRKAAYEAESLLLRENLPYLNQRH